MLWSLSRAELAREFDRVLVFADGHLVEEGWFDELERGSRSRSHAWWDIVVGRPAARRKW